MLGRLPVGGAQLVGDMSSLLPSGSCLPSGKPAALAEGYALKEPEAPATPKRSKKLRHVVTLISSAKSLYCPRQSLVTRRTSCGKPGCRYQGDPPQRHGPYWQYSRAEAGKTISRRLTKTEADLYRSWIANRRRLKDIITRMEQTSAAAAQILLRQAESSRESDRGTTWGPKVGGENAIEKCGTSGTGPWPSPSLVRMASRRRP